MKNLKDVTPYQTESDQDDAALARVGGFLTQTQVEQARRSDGRSSATPGSFGHMAKNIADETFNAIMGQGNSLAREAKNQPVGRLFFYQGSLLVKTPFKTIVSGQTYVDVLQARILELTTVSAELEINQLKKDLNTVTSGGFFGLIRLAFKRLFKRG